MSLDGLSAAEANEFAASWLPAWTGNDPEHLVSFYFDRSEFPRCVARGGSAGVAEEPPD